MRVSDLLIHTDIVTLGVEESVQLSAQLCVRYGRLEEGVLLCQLLRTEVLCGSSHPFVVVQQSQESSVGGFGEQTLIHVTEQAGSTKNTNQITQRRGEKHQHEEEDVR